MRIEEKLEEILAPSLKNEGYEIVRIKLSGGKSAYLQIMVERIDQAPITLKDCETVTNHASVLLDVEDLIKDSYSLEVSSPGIDRPLVKKEDYKRFCGEAVVIKTHSPIANIKKFKGKLESVTEKSIQLVVLDSEAIVSIEYGNIASAHLSPES